MNKTEIKQMLTSYFKGVEAEIDVVMVGRIPYLDIQYTDFKPSMVVHDQLMALLPNAEWTRLERTYSRQRIMEELWQLYRTDTEVMVSEGEGMYRRTLVPIWVQERMQAREFTQIQE